MTSIDWDSMDSSPYVKWDTIGDTISGTITDISVGQDFNGNPCPVLGITTTEGEGRILSCGQANLKQQMIALKPNVMQTITVTFSSEEKATKGMRKVFTIELGPNF